VGIFYRGETHVMSVLTLGSPSDAQIIEGMEMRGKKQFMHHYNFPPFSTGETGRSGNVSRRSVGHGALAEKSLRAIIPDQQTFPYTIRLVSESMASNGSTSMASVCASSLALADGGVPIKRHIAGIAMGIMTSNAGGKLNYKILTDIQGPEDHFGDMDFKVAGTDTGITAIQLDVKIPGLTLEQIAQIFSRAKVARASIQDRLDYELEIIAKTGFAAYFLIVQDFVNWAKQNNIVVGPGRGSAAGSLVSYLLNITDVDPIKYKLLFERFLNPERISMPDIDMDFADIRREDVLKYVEGKYGSDHVAQIITFGTIAGI
jgi:polyribonucleotide nucleotidyltransferase